MPAGDPSIPSYPDVPSQPDFPGIEREILDFWKADGTFQTSIDQRPAGENGANEFVFYDGPPFANGLPHFGHVLTGYVKDAVPRYKSMRGRRVERRFGWDCHGLPAEQAAWKELGLETRADVMAFGVDKFNDHCRTSVLRYTSEWEEYVTRQARWVDFENDYKTLDLSYMESVMWAIKQLWDKGLIYEGYKVVPYCWECETPLSNFETRQDDAYRDRQDPAVTVAFELESGERLLVWTTTPWTLPSNLALAVGTDIDYAVYEEQGIRYVLGEATVAKYEAQLGNATRVDTIKGSALVGLRYTPLFPWFADTANAFRVLAADFVDTEEGTGVVHIAPGFGEDDQRLAESSDIPVVAPVDDRGRFTDEVEDFVGMQVFDANPEIIRSLKDRGALVRHDSYVHSYPHCWRSDTPLIYKAVSSWFVDVKKVRDRMVELNDQIAWFPQTMGNSFAKSIAGAPDWPISRNRFWGSPIPVWKSDNPEYPRVDVYGSLDELERDFGVRPTDLHRPAIDELTRPNPDDPTGQTTMRRVEEVLDCWFESGSMPFAQVHYPFENREWFEHHYPGDFIVEYVSQLRGWFYTLHVLATALFDRPAFQSCMVHGVILDDEGQKLSKRSKNYTDPLDLFDKTGSDGFRWFLLSSAILRGGNLVISERGIADSARQVLYPLWSAWHLFTLYANTDGYRARYRTDAPGVLDRYILAKAHELVDDVTTAMDAYDLFAAAETVTAFIEALNNWYIRRSRPRFWKSEDDADKADAFDTLYTVLVVLSQVAAPMLPMVTETLYRSLTGERSVHLTDWPEADALPADPDLVAAMDLARDVCSAAHSVRKAQGLRARLPLPSLTVAGPNAARLAPYASLIEDEVNVKQVRLSDEATGERVLQVNPRVVGPRLGPAVQKVLAAARAGDWQENSDGTVEVAGQTLEQGEFTINLTASDEATSRALPGSTGVIVLDVTTTPALEAEGVARDVVRMVNAVRREEGLHVSDRIHLVIDVGHHHDVHEAVEAHRDTVMTETLATELGLARLSNGHRHELADGRAIHIGVTNA